MLLCLCSLTTWNQAVFCSAGLFSSCIFFPQSPLPTANVGKIAAKFLEEEEERSQHILDRLDAHIEELKRESEKTVQQFTHQK